MFCQHIINFVMTRNGLFLTGRRVVVDIVTPAMPQKDTAHLLKLANKLLTLHSAISLVL